MHAIIKFFSKIEYSYYKIDCQIYDIKKMLNIVFYLEAYKIYLESTLLYNKMLYFDLTLDGIKLNLERPKMNMDYIKC